MNTHITDKRCLVYTVNMQTGFTEIYKWNAWQKLLFRFFASYFFIFIFPFPVGYIPFIHILNKWYNAAFDVLISFTGKHLFHISFPLAATSNGSGDTVYNYVQLFLFVVLAILATIAWCVAQRKQKSYDLLLHWILIYLRYYLALIILKYGFEKIIKTQFAFPYYSLNETYGESSPMRLLWSFMGYSTAFNVFMGMVEIVGGLLLLFRKTKTFGSLICITFLLNVVVINFCFDVPVKLFALNLLLMAIFIVVPDIRRLIDLFFRNKAVPAINFKPEFSNLRLNIIWSTIKFIVITYIIYATAINVWNKYNISGDAALKKTPLFGLYNVEKFIRNNDTLLPLVTDVSRWKKLNIIFPKHADIEMMNDSMKAYSFFTDTSNKKIELYNSNDKAHTSILSYFLPDSLHLILSGKLNDDSVYILLRKQDLSKLELMKRDFHWINEYPYNK